MSKTLKIVFTLKDQKTSTISIADPKDGLTKAEVQTAVDEMVAKDFLRVSGFAATGVKEFYIQSSDRVELA